MVLYYGPVFFQQNGDTGTRSGDGVIDGRLEIILLRVS